MLGDRVLEKIAGRRAELDVQVEELSRRLEELRAEREELAVAEKVLRRLEEQVTVEAPLVRPGQVGGWAGCAAGAAPRGGQG